MTYDLDKLSSWTSYKSRALSEGMESEPHSAIAGQTLRSKPNRTHDIPSHCRSRETLQKSLKLSNDENIQVSFKWMRPHPALFLQAASKTTPAEIAIDASRIANMNPTKQTKKRGWTAAIQSNIILPGESEISQREHSFVARPAISVDVTNLLDPPLLSEWLPGQDLSIAYDATNATDDNVDQSARQVASGSKKKDHDLSKFELRDEIMKVIVTNSASISSQTMEMVDKLSDKDWIEMLPSYALVDALGEPTLSKILKALGRLLSMSSSQDVGTHVLTVLIPVFFQSLETDEIPNGCEESVNEIALLLIDRCKLGNLSKSEVLKLSHGIPNNTCGIKLRLSLAQEYFSYKKRTSLS